MFLIDTIKKAAFATSIIILFTSPVVATPVLNTVEDFAAGPSDWWDAPSAGLSDWSPGGGAPGTFNGHLTETFNFVNSTAGNNTDPALFRAQDEFGSSAGMLEGDYITAGVDGITAWVRHDVVGSNVNFFARAAGPANFPAAVILNFVPVPANTWVPLTFDINPTNQAIIYEGGPSNYFSVFGDVGHVQIGVIVNTDVEGVDQDYSFDLDGVSLTPEPSSALLAALLLPAAILRRRRAR